MVLPAKTSEELEAEKEAIESKSFYCHWDTHGESVLFSNETEFDSHLKDHVDRSFEIKDPVNQCGTVACHWDSCHELLELDSIMDHLRSYHWKDADHPHDGCGPVYDDPHFVHMPTLTYSPDELHTHSHSSESTRCSTPNHSDSPAGYVHVHSHGHAHSHEHDSSCEKPTFHMPLSTGPIPCASIPNDSCCGPVTCRWVHNGEICGKTFTTSHDLNCHLESVHIGRGLKSYTCEWEGCTRHRMPFGQRQKAVRHLQVHAKNWCFKCQMCGHLFNDEAALRQHRRLHLGERPHVCDICGKSFAAGSSLTVHRRTHTGEKPLVCKYPGCGKRFSESSNLAKHMKTHGPKQFQCDICSRKFTRRDQLQRHMIKHRDPNDQSAALQPAPNMLPTASMAEPVGNLH